MDNARLSPHFTVSEFHCHNGAFVPWNTYGMLSQLVNDYLEPLRAAFGPTVVLSGYRTPAYNRSVGGARRSFHVYDHRRQGVAADVRCMHGNAHAWYQLLESLHPGGLGIYRDHVHVDNRAGQARW